MSESISINIQFKSQSAEILTAELALIESILPDLIQAIQAENRPENSQPKSVE